MTEISQHRDNPSMVITSPPAKASILRARQSQKYREPKFTGVIHIKGTTPSITTPNRTANETYQHQPPCDLKTLSFTYPLRLMSPSRNPKYPLHRNVYVLTHGGGILSGDRISLSVTLEGPVSLCLLTQGSTKVFKTRRAEENLPKPMMLSHSHLLHQNSRPQHQQLHESSTNGKTKYIQSQQYIHATISKNALLCLLPDPVTPFSDSSYQQRQLITLESGESSLVMVDWFTAGRVSRGEVWDFKEYESHVK
ncbi:hypothetical protein HDU76_009761, partial [Blyttiomyces sp. JEL0837]